MTLSTDAKEHDPLDLMRIAIWILNLADMQLIEQTERDHGPQVK